MTSHACRDLRVEHEMRPLAIDADHPRMSWIVEHDQVAYRLVVADAWGDVVWDSGRVDSTETSLLTYAGPPLETGADYAWHVESWSNECRAEGASTFGTALAPDEWDAPWIEPAQDPAHVERWSLGDWIRGVGPKEPVEERLRPVSLLRQSFELPYAPVRARLRMTTRGIYSAWLGGARIGDEVLAPGFDSYESRISVQTYDVTDHLIAGENVLAVALADGWWAGRIGLTGSSAQFGDRTSATWRIELTFADGTSRVVRSGGDVRSATGPWVYTDLFVGERYDARAAECGWVAPGYRDDAWTPVRDLGVDSTALVAFRGEPVRRVGQLPAEAVVARGGDWIVDFGQVIAGRVRITLRGLAPGDEVVIEHTETLAGDGSWFVNIDGINKEQTDVYVADGADEATWEPEFTFHGFRYARIRGVESLATDDVVAVVIASDLEQTGRFKTSDARLNRLHENVVWSQRANFLSIPTDCPQRERAGWTGDLQVFAPAATNNARVTSFLRRWLDNVRADQLDDGRVTIMSPYSPFDARAAAEGDGIGGIVAAAGWSDAIAIVPWVLYERTGDQRILEENLSAIRAWIAYQARTAADEVPSFIVDADLAPERRERQALLYNSGEHFGDWLTPSTMEGKPTHEAIGIAPVLTSELVAPMFQAHTLAIAARISDVLGHHADAAELAHQAERVRDAFRREYVSDRGELPVRLQGMYVLAIGLGIVSDEMRQTMGDRLAELVRERGSRLDTGFLSMPYLLDALWETGHRGLAREVLWQDEAPSWLYEVDRGATTIWEAWDVIAPDGAIRPMSMNHYAFGCVDDWLFRRVAGIVPVAPGWRRALIEPDLDAGLEAVDAAVSTPYGELSVSWHREGDRAAVRVDVPHGVDADLAVAGRRTRLRPGRTEHVVDFPSHVRT